MKKIYKILGVFILICFSFYYTESAVNIVKRNDPIMKEIKKVSNMYETNSIDAILVNNNIIPGKSGISLDIDKSYLNMKKLGKFNNSLLQFKSTKPKVSVTNNYDKLIISGNKSDNKVSLIFKIKDTNLLDKIIDILRSKGLSSYFFLDYDLINKDNVLKYIINNNMYISYLGNNKEFNKGELLVIREILYKYNNIDIFFLSESEDKDIINVCSKEKIHTIKPSIVGGINPYLEIKKNIENGSIIELNNNKNTIKELRYIINYIKSKGYKIVSLNTLLKE